MQYLYLISCKSGFETFYKVGISNDVEARLAQLQTGNPLKLSIEACYGFNNAEIVEKSIHQAWKNEKVRGEWFDVSGCEDNFNDICKLMNGEVYVPYDYETTEESIEEAEEIGESSHNAKFDFVAMFSDGWWIERSNSKGKREYWVWRKTLETGRDYLYGGRIVDLPKSLEEMQAWRRSIIDGVSVMEGEK